MQTSHFDHIASLLMKQNSGNWSIAPQNPDEALARVQQSYAILISHGSDLWNFGEQLQSAMTMRGLSPFMNGLLEHYKIESAKLLDTVSV